MPDALSRIPCPEISDIHLIEPEVDLNSPHFNDQEYEDLKKKILENSSRYPDIKVIEIMFISELPIIPAIIMRTKSPGNYGYLNFGCF